MEPIVRWNAAGRVQELGQPLAFDAPELGNGHEVIRATDDRAHRDAYDIDQGILHFPTTRIGQIGK
jgi:hypothetical protein